METISKRLNGVQYQVQISGTGDPLILLHGFTGSSANWTPIVERFEGRYQVIAPDLPGHGDTVAPPDAQRYRMENAAQDLIALWQVLELPPAHWLGYSMGARLALYVALSYPDTVKSLILESGSPGLADAAERAARVRSDEALAARIEQEGIAAFITTWEALPLFATQSEAQRDSLRGGRLKNSPTGLANSLRGMGTGVQPSLWNRLPDLTQRTLLIVGEQDIKFTEIARRMVKALPQARLIIIPGVGHTTHLEQSEQFIAALQSHLNS